ncbi:aminopeptidase N [Thalassomonas viridans]|uniref:Aminopeptidase N n=1 Tax=Thalassomonas viridans TaxID=137584 RepID=A0AAE9Z228_9GAMM|nr:aminopeptidase N [Thalassomonas viridans]WDE03797.1 aminopeptidase N [Thalassomonas viridans]
MAIFKPNKRQLLLVTALSSALTVTGCSSTPDSPSAGKLRDKSEFLSGEYAKQRAAQISNVNYRLSLKIDHTSDTFSGSNTITFDLEKNNNRPLTIDFEEGEIASVSVNGQAAAFQFDKWFITIPAHQLVTGQNTLVINYSRKYSTDGSGFHRFVDPENKEVYLYTDFEPYDANRLFPHFDQPDLKARYTLDVLAPSHWQVISTTRENKITTEGDFKHWHFPQSAKISSYVFALHAGNYVVWEDKFEDIPLRLFARQSLAENVKTDDWFTPTKQSFKFFNDYFDIRYPFGKYDQIIAPDFNSGAMENVAAVTFNESYVSRGEKSTRARMNLANTIAHEMAHMWFGDLVTMRWWNGLWLNESFATYMANLAIDQASDFTNTWDYFYTGMKQWAYRSDDSVNTHAIELEVPTTGDALTNFDGITYGKGAAVLKQVYHYLGEEEFRTGVSNYLKKFAYKNTDLDDFMTELGKAAGKDLSQWTQDWLYQPGLNTIEASYQCEHGKISSFTLEQSAPKTYPTLREQRVQVGLYNFRQNTMALTDKIAVTYKGKSTSVDDAIGKACPDLVYPNEGDWGYVRVNLDAKSLAAAKQHINALDNATMRIMLWQSLFDSVRDAKLSAADFVDFALENIQGEKDHNVSRKIASSLTSTLRYLDMLTYQGRHDYSDKHNQVADTYYQLLSQAEAGSDAQKLWYSRFVSVANSPKHLAILADILDNKLSFDGLPIDQDKRWTLVAQLNRYQFADYQQRLTAETAQDNSDTGVNYGLYARVQRPQEKIKTEWFDTLINNPQQLKLARLRYIMAGLFPAEQQALKTPYRERIVGKLRALNDAGNIGLLNSFARMMLPEQCTSDNETFLAGLVKDSGHMKAVALKNIRASHQQVNRCNKILALVEKST